MNFTLAPVTFRIGVLIVLFGFGSLPGCASERKQHQVNGTVEYNGAPLPEGNIYFDPMPGNQDASQGFAYIKAGRFSTAMPGGRGVGSGKYLVRIVGFDGQATDQKPEGTLLFDSHEIPGLEFPEASSEHHFEVPLKK